jgi:putative peptidoglycan lipid II flippase
MDNEKTPWSTATAKNSAYPSAKSFWLLGFVYASLMALLLQKVVLPLMPELHAGHGLLMNDAIVFHKMAMEMAERISAHGWSEWSLFSPGATGNVALLAAIYSVFGPDPAWFIPINAAAHVTGALLIYLLGQRLWPGNVGRLGGLIAGIAFLAFPSALQWYGQNHKDSFAILGTLLVLDAWIDLHSKPNVSKKEALNLLLRTAIGSILVGFVRPYYVAILCAAILASFAVLLGLFKYYRLTLRNMAGQLLLIISVSLVALFFVQIDQDQGLAFSEGGVVLRSTAWEWKTDDSMPELLEKPLQRASELRAHFVEFGRSVSAGSEIDGERVPDNSLSALAYMPRALFVGLFAPFPDTWTDRVTAPRLIVAMETVVWYLFFLGTIVFFIHKPPRQLLAGVVFCATLLVMLAYIHPNVGTLYRQRFGVWQFFLLCGSIGWAKFIVDYIKMRRLEGLLASQSKLNKSDTHCLQAGGAPSGVDQLVASGAIVILITLICYLGFFARDLMMVKQLGMGDQLDAFFTAAMIPMFFVTCFAMPMADSLTVNFTPLNDPDGIEKNEPLLQSVLGFAVLILGSLTFLVYIFAPDLAAWVLGSTKISSLSSATLLLQLFSPIILLSAWAIIGNAALNALGCQRIVAFSQICVPVVTIIALLLASPDNAAVAVIGGMLFGTLLNNLCICFYLKRRGFNFTPTIPSATLLRPVTLLYRKLILLAFLPAVLIPMNYAFAASVTSGGISAWAFANKIVVLFTGLSSVAATAVVLPHLTQLFAHGRQRVIRDDANLLLVLGAWLGGLMAVCAFLFSEPIVAAVLSSNLSQFQVTELANIIKVGVLQLPIVITGALITKMAIVSGASSYAMYSTMLGFIVNLLANVILVPRFGVMGVAVGALSAIIVSTLFLFIFSYRNIGLSLKDLLVLFLSCLLWIGACITVSTVNATSVACLVVVIACLLWVQSGLIQKMMKRPHLSYKSRL